MKATSSTTGFNLFEVLYIVSIGILFWSNSMTIIRNLSFPDIILMFCVFLGLTAYLSSYMEKVFKNPILFPALLILMPMIFSLIVVSNSVHVLLQIGQLIFIWIFLIPLAAMMEKQRKIAWFIVVIYTIVNAIMLIISRLGFSYLAWDTGSGRYATLLAYPGGLGKIGMMISVLSLLKVILERKWLYFIAWLAAIIALYMDGSRTSLIMLALSTIGVIIIISGLEFKNQFKLTKRNLKILAIVFVIFLFVLYLIYTSPLFKQRVLDFDLYAGEIKDINFRFNQILIALNKVLQNPFWGYGFGNTMREPIHNAYLQMFADLGIIAFVGLLFLVIIPIVRICHWIKWSRDAGGDLDDRIIAYNALFAIVFTGLHMLFMPLGLSRTDWIYFMLASPYFYPLASTLSCKGFEER